MSGLFQIDFDKFTSGCQRGADVIAFETFIMIDVWLKK